jgi:uncharacterized protein YgfB (UPF0149 family)
VSDLLALALNAIDGPVATLSVSELHGAVVGAGVAGPELYVPQVLIDLLGADALADLDSVQAFVNAALDALQAPDMSFSPLLPDDEEPLEARIEALSEWTAGFLAGLTAGFEAQGDIDYADLPETAREIVDDFAAIAEADPDSVADAVEIEDSGMEVSGAEASGTEIAERELLELQEFVKVGALLLRSLLHDGADDPED